MGQEEVPGHVEAGGNGRAEGKGRGLEEDGAEDGKINLRKNLDGTSPTTTGTLGESMVPSTKSGLRPRPDRCSSPDSSLRTGLRRHRISNIFQVPGHRAGSLRIERYTKLLGTTDVVDIKDPIGGNTIDNWVIRPWSKLVTLSTTTKQRRR